MRVQGRRLLRRLRGSRDSGAYLIAHDSGEIVHALVVAARGGAARAVDAVREEHRAQRRQRGLVVPPRQRPVSPGNVAADDRRILLFYGAFRLCAMQQLLEAGRALGVACLDLRGRDLPRVEPKEVPPQPGPGAGAEAVALSNSHTQRSGADDCALSGEADLPLADEGFRGWSHA